MGTPRAQIAVFFLVATAIYGSLHAYLWWKATRQLGLRGTASFALGLFFALMIVAPFLGRLLRDGSTIFNASELFTFLWMGVAFYLFVLNLGADLWNLVATIARAVSPVARITALGGPRLFWGIAAATALIVVWAAIEASNVSICRLVVPTERLAPGRPGSLHAAAQSPAERFRRGSCPTRRRPAALGPHPRRADVPLPLARAPVVPSPCRTLPTRGQPALRQPRHRDMGSTAALSGAAGGDVV